jgi:hypothetical protein
MRRARIWLGCLFLASVAACSGRNAAPDASGSAGASGGGGAAGTGGGQAGNAAGGRGGSSGGGGSTGAGGQAGPSTGGGAGGQAGSSAGRGGNGGGNFCSMLAGMTWLSTTEQECGRGGLRCRWRIIFTATMFDWQHSDVAESGTYTCSGNMVTGQRLGGTNTIPGQYDPASQILTWDGLAYTPQ